MRTAGDMPLAGQHGQERLNVGGSHVPGVAHGATCPCRPAHEKAHPVDVGFFGVETIVAVTQALPQLIQQAGGMQDRSGGFHGEFIPVFLHSVWPGEASCTRLSAVSVVGCIRLRQFYPAGFAGYITLANFFNDPLIMKNILFVASAALFLSACASPARYAWVKEGASDHQRTNDTSECTYQVRLNKTPVAEQKELHSLCMQGKGYRMKRIG